MAVVEKYANADLEAGKLAIPALSSGAEKKGAVSSVELVSGDSNNSIFRMFKGLNPEIIPTNILLSADALGASGACHIGLYESGKGEAVVDADCFAASVDVSSAVRRGDGMATVSIENFTKKLFEHAGHTVSTKLKSYDLCITVTNVGGTGAGTLSMELEYLH
jgi:hypothetical protein